MGKLVKIKLKIYSTYIAIYERFQTNNYMNIITSQYTIEKQNPNFGNGNGIPDFATYKTKERKKKKCTHI